MQNKVEFQHRLSDSQRTQAAAGHLVAMATQRFPPDLVELSPWLEPFLEPDFDPQMRVAALRVYAQLYWQLEAHPSVFGPH